MERWDRRATAEERRAFAHGTARVRAMEQRADARALGLGDLAVTVRSPQGPLTGRAPQGQGP